EPRLHRRPLLGEASLLAFLRCQRFDFRTGVLKILAIALGRRGLGSSMGQFAFYPRDLGPGSLDRTRVELAESVEQCAMAFGIEQPAVVVLPVDLDGERAHLAQQACG